MGAGVFHGRVRDGIGWFTPRHGHQVVRANRYVPVGLGVWWVGACERGEGVWVTAVRVCGVEPIGRLGPVS